MIGEESSGSPPELVTTLTEVIKLEHPVNFELKKFKMPESVNVEVGIKSLNKKKKQMEQEDESRGPCRLDEDSRINGMGFDEDGERKKILNLVGTAIKSLLEGNSKMAVNKLQTAFDEISKFPTTVFKNTKDYIWTKYAYFTSLVEENNYSDLLNAYKLLQELEKSLYSDMPIYHYAMAKLLVKFNRFRLAENEIKLCQDSMKDHDFLSYNWPGTEDIIKETTSSGLEEFLNDLIVNCGCYYQPKAICKFAGCIDASSHPFPSREIFESDPDSKGYVVLTCQEGCKIQYHPLCWKKVKDGFSDIDKLSDKDCLGKPCVTPDCKNGGNEPSVIHKIEVISSDGSVKSQCVPDQVAENKQKEIALSKKRLRLKSDEHKTEKQSTKNKPRQKKAIPLNHAQSIEDITISMKNLTPKESNTLQISGFIPAKVNTQVKKEDTKHVEKINDDASQKEFICSYFHMLLTKKGPFNRKKLEEEWEKFYPSIEPFYSLIPEKNWLFNLLKNSKYFFVIEDYLYARESNGSSVESEYNSAFSKIKAETNNFLAESKPYSCEEIEKKFLGNSAVIGDMNIIPGHSASWLPKVQSTSTQMVNTLSENPRRETVLEKDVVIKNSIPNPQGLQSSYVSFGFFDDTKPDMSVFSSHMREINKLPEVSSHERKIHNLPELSSHVRDINKVPELSSHVRDINKVPELSTHVREINKVPEFSSHRREIIKLAEANMIKNPGSSIVPEMVPVREDFRVVTPPVRWRDDVYDLRYTSQFYTGPPKPIMNEQFERPEKLICKDGFCQTDPIPESKNDDHDELWVQHMQLAVNDLLKKNKELLKSREQMELAHKNEVEALANQMQILRDSYAEQIKALKESHSRNFEDDRRRMMALEARIKVQEEILQSTREELRKKDFDLLDAKKYLGIAILESLERESTKQVQRLVAALAVLPCNGHDAEAVGQAMARWESAGVQASKAKNIFLEQCTKCQAILYEGYGSDSFENLTIPIIEEPAGQCPLDKIALNLLSEKETAESDQAKAHPGPYERQPYRMRLGNVVGGPHPAYSHRPSPSYAPAPISPGSFGARPRETPPATNGETSGALRSWPSTSSIPNSTQSSSTGNAAALTCSKKLLMELKKAYPSRSDDELWYAVVSVRRNNKNSLSGLTIKRIVALVGNVLEWWPEPSEGSMGLDKFIGWAADTAIPSEDSLRGAQKTAWSSANSSPKRETEKDDCCICLQAMSSPKTELNCSHTFHTECIRKWLSKESVCPICRKFTRMADEFPTLK